MALNDEGIKQILLRWPLYFRRAVNVAASQLDMSRQEYITHILAKELGLPAPPTPAVAAKRATRTRRTRAA